MEPALIHLYRRSVTQRMMLAEKPKFPRAHLFGELSSTWVFCPRCPNFFWPTIGNTHGVLCRKIHDHESSESPPLNRPGGELLQRTSALHKARTDLVCGLLEIYDRTIVKCAPPPDLPLERGGQVVILIYSDHTLANCGSRPPPGLGTILGSMSFGLGQAGRR